MSADRKQLELFVGEVVRSYGNDHVFGLGGGGLVADVLAAPGPQSDDVTALRAVHALIASGSSDLAEWQRLRDNPTVAHLPEEAVAWASATWRTALGSDPAPTQSASPPAVPVQPAPTQSASPPAVPVQPAPSQLASPLAVPVQPAPSQLVSPPPVPSPPPPIEVLTGSHTVVHTPAPASTSTDTPAGLPPVDLAPPTPEPEDSSKRLILGAAIGTIVLALGIGGGIWASGRESAQLGLPTAAPDVTVVPTAVVNPTLIVEPIPTDVAPPTAAPTAVPTVVPTATPLPRPTPLPVTLPTVEEVAPVVPAGDVVVPVLGSLGFTIPEPHPIKQHGGHTLVYVDGSFNAEVDIFTPAVTRDGVPLDSLDQVVEYFENSPNFVHMQAMGVTVVNGFEAQVFDGEPRVALQRAFFTDPDNTTGDFAGWFAPQQLRIWFIDTPRGVLAISAESLSDDQVSFTAAVILASDILATLDLT